MLSKFCFVLGKPAELEDVNNPDWIPSLKMKAEKSVNMSPLKRQLERHARCKSREIVNSISFLESNASIEENEEHSNITAGNEMTEPNAPSEQDLGKEIQSRLEEISMLKRELQLGSLDEIGFENNDSKVLFYTGLANYKVLKIIQKIVEPYLGTDSNLSPFQQMLLTLMHMRLNLKFTDLGYRFRVSRQTATRCYLKCLSVMYQRMKTLIRMPKKAALQNTMPQCFFESFGTKVCYIVDCFEIFIEKPAKLVTAASCWSQYKHHYTIKYLIGIVPQGSVAYISKAWGGRTSDKHITENSGFLDLLQPGDVVMADRGFLIQDSLNHLFCQVILPDFTKGKKQLSPHEVENTRKIANVRIHVERVIGALRQKFEILHGTIPIATVVNKIDGVPETDMIVTVCCALINLSKSVVPQ